MTTSSHGWSKAIVASDSTTTPPATRRADTSFTGSGNENTFMMKSLLARSGFQPREQRRVGARAEGADEHAPRAAARAPQTQDDRFVGGVARALEAVRPLDDGV